MHRTYAQTPSRCQLSIQVSACVMLLYVLRAGVGVEFLCFRKGWRIVCVKFMFQLCVDELLLNAALCVCRFALYFACCKVMKLMFELGGL